MIDEIFGRTFCLIHKAGVRLYPVRVKNRDSGKVAFRISSGGKGGNTKDIGSEETDESVVFGKVTVDGWAVRVASRGRKTKGLYKIGEKSITGFEDLR